jgi:hypothetical protein
LLATSEHYRYVISSLEDEQARELAAQRAGEDEEELA